MVFSDRHDIEGRAYPIVVDKVRKISLIRMMLVPMRPGFSRAQPAKASGEKGGRMRHILLLLALLSVVGFWAGRVEAAQLERLSYDEFLQKVQAGEVKSVSLGPLDYLEGVYSQGDAEKEFFSQHQSDKIIH